MPRFYYITGAQVLDGGETPFLKRRNKRQKRLVGIYVGKWVGVWYLDVDRRDFVTCVLCSSTREFCIAHASCTYSAL